MTYNLIRLQPAHYPGPIRYFANGRPITRARYHELFYGASVRDSFITEAASIWGGFLAWRHRCVVRTAQ
jgi:hypothetical protein